MAVLVASLALAACGGGDVGDGEADRADEAEAGTASDATAAEAAALFDEVADDGPGCAAAVGVDGEPVWADGFGVAELDSGEPIGDDTVFDVGSTSKIFTATLVLLLAEQGQLDLDAPLSDVLEDLPAWSDDVSLRQLLLHTAGVPDYVELLADEGYDDADTTTAGDALDALAEVEELDFEPGERFEYSNSGYFLAAEAVTAAAGEPFADVMAAEVFGPYDLDAEVDPVTDDPRRATSYESDGDDGWSVADSAWEQVGDGAIQTTPTELVVWAEELWDPTLGDEVAAARLEDVVDDDEDLGYGLGIVVDEHDELGPVLSHSGAWAGFVSDLVVLPDQQVAAAVTCNQPDLVDPTEAATALAELWAG